MHLPEQPDPVPPRVLEGLPPEEAAYAVTLRGYRQVQFVGGRIALRRACEQLGRQPPPLLSDGRGAPVVGSGLSGSVSHKRDLAVGMACMSTAGSLGVDIEDYGPARPGIESSVLTEPERAAIAELPERQRWMALLIRFSIKESIYKALDPFVRRYVGFLEAQVDPDLEGEARVALNLTNGEGPFDVDARYEWLYGRLLTSVRIRPQ